ncbi:MAG TPA: MaoC family dehydratase [Thermotogota bacterium]|nr:MaoC family dehydratase [Thermotogota bacterium]HPJ87483.1 MaoC family dehydratase [Thermotogota bacterium]HPR94688.1 MaoC family dehydratase [Thermotogota bacterium]
MDFKEIKVGDSFSMDFKVTDEKVLGFADVSGDNNPVHVDDEFAKNTRFGKRIAHGMLITSFISKVLGRDFPGDGTIYVSQEVKFKRPVFIDDIVTVKIEVIEKRDEKNRLILSTDVFNAEGKKVIEGQAEVLKS